MSDCLSASRKQPIKEAPEPGAQGLLQYDLFLRLGQEGYREVHQASQDVAKYLAEHVGAMPEFDLWNDGSDIPVFAYRLTCGHSGSWTLYDLSDRLREHGWLVPAYPMPDDLSDATVQRIVVRNGLSIGLARKLLNDIEESVRFLDHLAQPQPKAPRSVPALSGDGAAVVPGDRLRRVREH